MDSTSYLRSLKEYVQTDATKRFQDLEGNLIFRKNNEWVQLTPPNYSLRTLKHQNSWKQKKRNLNSQLQFQRNMIGLTNPAIDPTILQEEVQKYNQGTQEFEEYSKILQSFSRQEDGSLKKLKEDLQQLVEQNQKLIRTEKNEGGSIQTTGDLADKEEEMVRLYQETKQLMDQLLENSQVRRIMQENFGEQLKLYELSSTGDLAKLKKLSSSDEKIGDLVGKIEDWNRVTADYANLIEDYQKTQEEIQRLKQVIKNQELSLFTLGKGSQPEMIQLTPDQVAAKREAISQQISTTTNDTKTLKSKASEDEKISTLPKPREDDVEGAEVTQEKLKPSEEVPVPTSTSIKKPVEQKTMRFTLKKKDCVKNLKKDLIQVATEAGIETKGKKKADICDELEKFLE